MTDRVKGCWVSFDKDKRVDDVETLVAAIKMLKGVQDVTLSLSNSDDWMNRSRIRLELGKELLQVIWPEKGE